QSIGKIDSLISRVGTFGIPGSDESFIRPISTKYERWFMPICVGEDVRDYASEAKRVSWYPYSEKKCLLEVDPTVPVKAGLWITRRKLQARATFSGGTYLSDGRPWYEW